jgi:uroporphyrin-III C-methyltransferase
MPSTSDSLTGSNSQSKRSTSLTLVGAGPGDPDLLTVKAINALKNADVVLYDALVSSDILALIPNTVITRSVGKRAGAHSHSQDEINELIVTMANQYGHVVRLKGGDPFVFGRGYEEILFAAKHGLSVSIVPGITSAIAAASYLNIPVTARGLSESVFIVTGTTRAGVLSEEIRLATQSSGTVVILMGLGQIDLIMEQFRSAGKGDLAVAVIENGTLPTARVITGVVGSICDKVRGESLGGPTVIVIGQVVECAATIESIITTSNPK